MRQQEIKDILQFYCESNFKSVCIIQAIYGSKHICLFREKD